MFIVLVVVALVAWLAVSAISKSNTQVVEALKKQKAEGERATQKQMVERQTHAAVALISCRDCKREYDKRSSSCPHCGCAAAGCEGVMTDEGAAGLLAIAIEVSPGGARPDPKTLAMLRTRWPPLAAKLDEMRANELAATVFPSLNLALSASPKGAPIASMYAAMLTLVPTLTIEEFNRLVNVQIIQGTAWCDGEKVYPGPSVWLQEFNNLCEEMGQVEEVHFEDAQIGDIRAIEFNRMTITIQQDNADWEPETHERFREWDVWIKRNEQGAWFARDVYSNDPNARDPSDDKNDDDSAKYQWRQLPAAESSLIEGHYKRCVSFFEHHPGWEPELGGSDGFWELKRRYITSGPSVLGVKVWAPPVHS